MKTNAPSPRDTLMITKTEDGNIQATAHIEKGRWFISSESNLPGWEAAIDGQTVPIYTANYIFQAVYIPAGTHELALKYKGIF